MLIKDGEGVRHAIELADTYATDSTQADYTLSERKWVYWDGNHFINRLEYDSLQTLFDTDPIKAREELTDFIPGLTTNAARLEASYNHAFFSWEQDYKEEALDTLKTLWTVLEDAEFVPYETYEEDLRQMYATMLYNRAVEHRQEGASAIAFTYLMQLTQLESEYTGRGFIEALRLARYYPDEAVLIEPRVEAVFEELRTEEQLAYLSLMGEVYRRIGNREKVEELLGRYKDIRENQ